MYNEEELIEILKVLDLINNVNEWKLHILLILCYSLF